MYWDRQILLGTFRHFFQYCPPADLLASGKIAKNCKVFDLSITAENTVIDMGLGMISPADVFVFSTARIWAVLEPFAGGRSRVVRDTILSLSESQARGEPSGHLLGDRRGDRGDQSEAVQFVFRARPAVGGISDGRASLAWIC